MEVFVNMALYTGNHCPVCNKAFTDTDDIVVCPECGTPYHRDCWQKAGGCVHEQEHADGYEWKPDLQSAQQSAEAAELERVCPNCGAHNDPQARFCSHCGTPFAPASQQTAAGNGPVYARPNGPDAGSASGQGYAGAAGTARQSAGFSGLFRREIGPEDTIDGIKAKDWASYLGPSSLAYLSQFIRMDETRRKTGVSFAAFFLGPVYFFYRKMWKAGIALTLLSFVLMLPTVLALFQAAGSPLVAGLNLNWLSAASWIFALVDWAQRILRSLFAFYWYKRESARRIQEICARLPEGQDRSDALVGRGGTSGVSVVIYLLVIFGVSLLIYWLMGSGRTMAMNTLMRAYMM